MADNSFGIKTLNLVGLGTPKIESLGDLNLNAVNVAISTNATIGGTLNVGGVITGDGSGISNVTGTGSGIVIRDSGSLVGTAATIDFGSNLSVSPISAGIVTITSSSGGLETGVGTFVATPNVEVQIDSFSESTYSSGEYLITLGIGTYRQTQKVLVLHDGGAGINTTAYFQEFAIMYNPEQVVSIAATYSGGNILIKATPESGISGLTTYRFTKNLVEGV